MEGLANDLEDRDLRVLREALRRLDLELDLDAVLHAELVGERAHRRAEALVAEHDGLELEGQVAQRADRLTLLFERGAEDSRRLLLAIGFDRGDHRVEHERDARHRLHRPVVQEQRQPPALLLLGGDQLVREPCVLGGEALDLLVHPLVLLALADEERRGERAGCRHRQEQADERQKLRPERRARVTTRHDRAGARQATGLDGHSAKPERCRHRTASTVRTVKRSAAP